jgi:hypothetical protein
MLFDIVILVGPHDINIIHDQIIFTKKNIIGYRNIYIVTNISIFDNSIFEKSIFDNSIFENNNIKIINESIFPFNINTIAKYHGLINRNGWYLQQLIKLYAGSVIPNILSTYLVIDCDTFFLKPTTFIANNKYLFNPGTEYHKPYFEHMKKLHPLLIKSNKNYSGISHHMIFDNYYLVKLFNMIEQHHNNNKLFWEIFLEEVIEKNHSGASEYEIYFNYMQIYHSDIIEIRKLNWQNTNQNPSQNLNHFSNSNIDYVSYHWYSR